MTRQVDDQRQAWLALAGAPGVGEATFARLCAHFGGPEAVLAAAHERRLAREGPVDARGRRLPSIVVEAVAEAARDPSAAARAIGTHGLWAITQLDRAYPTRLEVLEVPPPVIYGWGDPACLETPFAVAVMGTSRPAPVGRMLAARLARHLVLIGAVVVSGLAFGIDGAAHAATVEAGGRTVAVIGGGHARPGPRAHRALIDELVAGGGALISEVAPDIAPRKGSFPRRNRLIAALADAVIVVEAPARSGALNTAHHALEQGRPLYVVPGRPGDPSVAGCLRLLRETPAHPLIGLAELDEDLAAAGLPPLPGGRSTDGSPGPADPASLPGLGPAEAAVAAAVARTPGGFELIVASTGLAPGVVSGAVTLLQLRGLVRVSDGVVMPAGPLLDAG